MKKRSVSMTIAAGLVLAGGGAAWAGSGTDRPAPAAVEAGAGPGARAGGDAAGGSRHHRGAARALFARAVHGDLLARGKDGQYQTVTFDKGKVDQAATGSVVLTRPDGKQVRVDTTPDTRYRGVEDAGHLRPGEPALVVSRDGKALLVVQRPEKSPTPSADREQG